MLQKIRFFDKKDPKLSLSELLSWMTIFKSIHMAFYVNTSWACTLFRNNKQHVVLGQKRVSTHGRKQTLMDSERKMNRSEVSSKCRIYVGDQTNSRKCYASKFVLNLQIFSLIGKPNMFFPSFLNRFHILWIYDDAYDHFR